MTRRELYSPLPYRHYNNSHTGSRPKVEGLNEFGVSLSHIERHLSVCRLIPVGVVIAASIRIPSLGALGTPQRVLMWSAQSPVTPITPSAGLTHAP